jgi:hypothetical protein
MSYIGNTSSVQQYAPQVAYFSGDASTVAFTLPVSVVSAAQIIVAVANVIQNPSSAFTVSGTTLTFTSAPPSGTNNIWVQYTTLQTNIVTPAAASVGLTQLSATGIPSSSTYLRGDNSWTSLTSSQWTTSSSNIYYNTGNVGIGISSPTTQLYVKGSGSSTFGAYNDPLIVEGTNYTYLHLKGVNNQAATIFNRNGTIGWFHGLDNNGNLKSVYMSAMSEAGITNAKDGTPNVLVTTTGNFLVGGGTPIGTDGNLLANSDYTSTYRSTSNTGAYIHAFASDVGGTRVVKYAVYANGTVGSVSDQNLKKNIEPARNYLDDLMDIEVVKYNWISDNEEASKELGYIAQQVEEIFPGMVTEQTYNDGDGNSVTEKMLKKEVLIPMMLKAIQELKALNDTLTDRITALESK